MSVNNRKTTCPEFSHCVFNERFDQCKLFGSRCVTLFVTSRQRMSWLLMSCFVTFFFIVDVQSVVAQWQQVSLPVETDVDLWDVHFADKNNGWIVGLESTILHTTDGGETWEQQCIKGDTASLFHVVFAQSSRNVWILGGWPNRYYKTTNGGLSWMQESLKVTFHANWMPTSVVFTDSVTGWMGGIHRSDTVVRDSAFVLKTTDAGSSWKKIYPDTLAWCRYMTLEAVDNEHVWVMCEHCFFYRTTDGAHLNAVNPRYCFSSPRIYLVDFLTPNIGFIGSDGASVVTGVSRTEDGGLSVKEGYDWTLFTSAQLATMSFADTSHGWIAATDFEHPFLGIWHTRDGGNVWDLQLRHQPTGREFQRSIFMIDSLDGWLVGNEALCYRTRNGGIVTSVDHNSALSSNHGLGQNYPNPFNPKTNISFTISISGMVTLRVHDLFGREVETLVDKVMPIGEYTIVWDAENVSSGVYYYQLSTPEITVTKRMTVLK